MLTKMMIVQNLVIFQKNFFEKIASDFVQLKKSDFKMNKNVETR